MLAESRGQYDALRSLAGRPCKELVKRQTQTGKLNLYHIYQNFCTSHLIPRPLATDDVARLHALFDVALDRGLSSVIVGYVKEVCSDPSLTSSDPLEAHLLDGECVSSWCTKALHACCQRTQQGLAIGLAWFAEGRRLREEAARINGILVVAQTLDHSSYGVILSERVELATRLQQLLKVLEYLVRHSIHLSGNTGRFSSRQEWGMVHNKRRDAGQGVTFFQEVAQSALVEHPMGTTGFQYPPESFARAVEGLFLHGPVSRESLHTKLALLLYCLLDAGHKSVLSTFGQAFGWPAREVSKQHALFLLDESLLDLPGSIALETACGILSGLGCQGMPLRVVEVLAQLGRPEVALTVLQTFPRGSRQDPEAALQQANLTITILLHCGHFSEAYFEVGRHCQRLEGEQRASEMAILIQDMLEWAASQGAVAMDKLTKLPLQGPEEETFLAWMEERVVEGHPAADFLVRYFLLRQRFLEARHALARLQPATEAEAVEEREMLQELLEGAIPLMPLPDGPLPPLRSAVERPLTRLPAQQAEPPSQVPPTLQNVMGIKSALEELGA